MAEGKIKRLMERGFGFIARDRGKDVFFHHKSLSGVSFDELREGMRVQFEFEIGPKGPAATEVTVIEPPETAGNGTPRPPPDHGEGGNQPGRSTDYRFYNPYNFVRFLESVGPNGSAKSPEAAPPAGAFAQETAGAKRSEAKPANETMLSLLGRCPPPPHDRYVGLTGRIECRLTAVTPLFVSDSDAVTERDQHRSYRFFRSGGKSALPASSLRGMLRSVFEAATNSCLINMAGETRLTRHTMPRESQALVPALVVEHEQSETKLALRLLPGKTPLAPGRRPTGHQYAQYAAWVGQYIGNMLRDSHNCSGAVCYDSHANVQIPAHRDQELWAVLRPYEHPRHRFKFYAVRDLKQRQEDLSPLDPRHSEIIGRGYLHITNQNIENKHDERFFFMAEGHREEAKVLIAPSAKKHYQDLIADYQDRHADGVEEWERRHRDPDKPDRSDRNRDKHKPAFSAHILNKGAAKLKPGDLVYARLDRKGGCDFLAPVSLPRIACENRIGDLLEPYLFADAERHDLPGNLLPCEHPAHLCPTCRTFGWVEPPKDTRWGPRDSHSERCQHGTDEQAEKEPHGEQKTQPAYAGRIRIGQGRLEHSAGALDPVALAILSGPKPTTTTFYLKRDGVNEQARAGADEPWSGEDAAKGYDRATNRLRGRKFYRHHPKAVEQEYRRAEGRGDNQNRTLLDALKPGAEFSVDVDFENLAPLELGALLWSLELEGRGFHRLGYGKPLGFGSVRVSVGALKLLDATARYKRIGAEAGWTDALDRKAGWIDGFKTAMARTYPAEGKNGFDKLPNIADLMTLCTDPKLTLPIHYPRTKPRPDADGKNFEWFVGNKRIGHILKDPQQDEGLPLLDRNAGRDTRRR